MSALSSAVSDTAQRATRLFFRYFFRLLLVAIAFGEWACLSWFVALAGIHLPRWTQLLGPALFYIANRIIVRLPRGHGSPLRQAAQRAYAAFAFTTVFGSAFLLLNFFAWRVIELLTHGVSLAAGDRASALAALPSIGYEWSSTAGLATIGLLFLWGYTFGASSLTVTKLRLPFRRAEAALAGVRIAQISDIHMGHNMHPEELAGYIEQVNALDADVVVVTGDLLDSLTAIPNGFPVFARLRARYGVFVILGNHDFYAGADEVTEALRRMTDFTVLRNDVATIHINGAPLHIAGVDDLGRDWARGVEIHPALAGVLSRLPGNEPVLLLSHRPDLFPQAAEAGVELVLSGHTHGGQLALPGLGRRPLTLARFITPFDRGLYRNGQSSLYVNHGLGCTAQRIRLFTPREITVIEIAGA